MRTFRQVLDLCAAQWNEPDGRRRRELVEELWSPDAVTCHRLLEAKGHDAIEDRVTTAYDKWIGAKGNVFRIVPDIGICQDSLRFHWVMAQAKTEEVVSIGCNYIFLDKSRRVVQEYQFPVPAPAPAPPLAVLIARYEAVWNTSSPPDRTRKVRELWAEDGSHYGRGYAIRGHDQIEQEIAMAYEQYGARGYKLQSFGDLDCHHRAARFDWRIQSSDKATTGPSGTALLLLDEHDRIIGDYEYESIEIATLNE